MKLYNYWIQFAYTYNSKIDRIDHERKSWCQTYEEAVTKLNLDLEWCSNNKGAIVYPIDYGIEEMEFNKIEMVGILDDNGEEYEDFQATIDGEPLDKLYNKFNGNKVRLTFEVLPND
jgi:hypothetical protein